MRGYFNPSLTPQQQLGENLPKEENESEGVGLRVRSLRTRSPLEAD